MAAALAGTVLDGRAVVEIPVPTTDEVTFGIECGSDEVAAAWQAARGALAATGRWPVAVWNVTGASGWLDDWAATQAASRRQLAEMRYATGDHSLGRPDLLTVPTPEVALADRLAALPGELGAAQMAEAAAAGLHAALGDEPDRLDVERWLLAWDVARPTPAPRSDHLDWFDPGPGCAILLFPVANGWETFAHVDFFPNGGELGSVARLVAVVRSWHQRFGAELVANWVTMLQFVVTRPPLTADEAWRLALEQAAVAPYTMRGFPLRDHARALVGRERWFLHNRP